MSFAEIHTAIGSAKADVMGAILDAADSIATIATNAYSGAQSNQAPHRHQAINTTTLGGTDYQVLCYWDGDGHMVVGVRTLPSGSWTLHTLDGTGGTPEVGPVTQDSHNSCVFGIDPNGYIHIAYDMHTVALNYRKSTNPIDSFNGSFGDETGMLGTNEDRVTYPVFLNDPSGNLYFMFRNGSPGNGNTYFYAYDESAEVWAAAAGTGTAGILIDGSTDSVNAYHYISCFDSDFASQGYMHLVWSWRDSEMPEDNNSVSYVRWDGTNWTQSDGSAQTIPIRKSNCEVIDNTGTGTGLTSMNGLDIDVSGNPHVAYIKNDGNGDAQIYHMYHNGTSWQGPTAVTSQPNYASSGDDPASDYPYVKIVVHRTTGKAFIVHRGFGPVNSIYVHGSEDYSTWTETRLLRRLLLGTEYKPLLDYEQWKRNDKLSLLVQPYATDNYKIMLLEWTP